MSNDQSYQDLGHLAVGDLVMFKNRCQVTAGGMRVEEVDSNMFDTKIKVNGRWWSPTAFIRHEDWLRAQQG